MNLKKVLASCTLLLPVYFSHAAQEFEFNSDVLSIEDSKNIDLSVFSKGSFVMPGTYSLAVHINKHELPDQTIVFTTPDDAPQDSVACITPALVEQFDLKNSAKDQLRWWHDNQCLDIRSLEGAEMRIDLGASALYVNIPQAWLEYSSPDWDPPSRWDEGVAGLLFDYDLNGQSNAFQGKRSDSLGITGTLGANLGAWRLRADMQGRTERSSGQPMQRVLTWNRYYAYRAIAPLRSRLTVGEDYLSSSLFDSFLYAGANLASDDNMLPPNLRGYAPEVSGVATTNARVTVSQQGRLLYETQVAAGPFRIQDISNAVSGKLDVRVEELDGSVQTYQMDTASIPYLTRPGSVRYKLTAGRPTDGEHNLDGPLFAAGEFSWGVSNGWSMYGGALGTLNYKALALGAGRDLSALGAISVDVTQSNATLPQGSLTGKSYRVSYSKRFDKYDSQVTFAGYRFSQENFMSMNEFLQSRDQPELSNKAKKMYTVSVNKQFREMGVSLYANYSHQTYWNSAANDRYSVSVSRYFDAGRFKNLSLSLTAYNSQSNTTSDRGGYLSLSMPWGNGSYSYSTSVNSSNTTHNANYSSRVNEQTSYQVSGGTSRTGQSVSGYLTHEGERARLSANGSYQPGEYSSFGASLQGGMTLTTQGGALHRTSIAGGTRLMLDTDGVSDVPIRGSGPLTRTNHFGKAVIGDVNPYYRDQASIDLDSLGDNVEATRSVTQATLTEGAIGYRKFDVISGSKAMVYITLPQGPTPPFGATVHNSRGQETGIVSENGGVYLSGIKANEVMSVRWDGKNHCNVTLPEKMPPDGGELDLLCREALTNDAA
ncbi:outer membrane usher protein [Pseudomonas shahriarae]|uniref:outer membrane usher protein n=1 Tax=Pseudomonas shahriarae TaxID=2745512 RepID=UPI002360ABB2|nr:outer membrane usher protein [Pseudomonas shahriarae]MDD1135703.1 outer membrane usher protein [Pseudomonas shahriarae]